jgi:hypothetical protein
MKKRTKEDCLVPMLEPNNCLFPLSVFKLGCSQTFIFFSFPYSLHPTAFLSFPTFELPVLLTFQMHECMNLWAEPGTQNREAVLKDEDKVNGHGGDFKFPGT